MAESADKAEAKPAKGGRKGFILGLVGTLVMAGAGYFAVSLDLIPGLSASQGSHAADADSAHGEGDAALAGELTGFVPLTPLVVSLGPEAGARHLQFSAQLVVDPAHAAEIAALEPRFLDVLNIYLRAVDERELEIPANLARLKAQMLRRMQIVAGNDRIKDLAITQFVLN